MSTRNIRKKTERLQEKDKKEAPDEPIEDFEPLYAKNLASAYSGLVLSSSSSTEAEEGDECEDDLLDMAASPATNKTKRKKNNRKNKKKNKKSGADMFDEVERSLREVNEMLGEPEAPAPAEPKEITIDDLLKIEHKHLDLNYELDRMFGPDDEDKKSRKTKRNCHKRRQITFNKDDYKFKVKGFEMVLIEVKDDVKYFKFSHSPEYQKNMQDLLEDLKPHYDTRFRVEPEVFASDTVEALIENLNLYFELEETSSAVDALEQAISFMQKSVDQSFNYTDGKTRLEYKYVENRVFHVALLQYLHVLTNKACHRTALEVAKLMLNLDPTDPLGVIFMLDTLAVRAREHRWLLDIYERWKDVKHMSTLFHMRYSVALSMWHIAKETQDPEDKKKADALIKFALVKFPNVAVFIYGDTKTNNDKSLSYEVFTTLANLSVKGDMLALLELLYAKFIAPKWRGKGIMEWVMRNAQEIIDYCRNKTFGKEIMEREAREFRLMFRRFPLQIQRHINSISRMSNLLADGEVPKLKRSLSFNPYPNQGRCVDQNRYYKDYGVKYPEAQVGVFSSFIASLVPDTRGGKYKCCDRHDIIRLYPGEAVPRLTLEEELFGVDMPDDLSNVRLDNGYGMRKREHQRRRERAFAVKVRRSAACSDAVAHLQRKFSRPPARHQRKNKCHVRAQAAIIRRHN